MRSIAKRDVTFLSGTVAMWALGALTPILLHLQGPGYARFPELFPALLGIPRP